MKYISTFGEIKLIIFPEFIVLGFDNLINDWNDDLRIQSVFEDESGVVHTSNSFWEKPSNWEVDKGFDLTTRYYGEPPKIKGPSGLLGDSTTKKSIDENLSAIHTFSANESVTWSLIGGNDISKFSIDSNSGALSFNKAPDFDKFPGIHLFDHAISYEESQYLLTEDSIDWVEAQQIANELGGHLVHINSQDEQDFIYDNFLKNNDDNSEGKWIGAILDDGYYKWVDANGNKQNILFSNWEENAPSFRGSK